MPDFLKKLLENMKNIWGKTTLVQKLIAGGVLAGAIVLIIVIFAFNTTQSGVRLFNQTMEEKDFNRITSRLAELNIPFTTKNNTEILVASDKLKNRAIMLLAEEGSMPKGKYNFLNIIEDKNITSTEFDKNIRLRAALEGKLEELLRSSELIQTAEVTFTMPEQQVFVNQRDPVRVAVMLTPAWGVDLKENRNAIKGIQELVVNSIDRATPENVTITDNYGDKLNDFTNEGEDMLITKTKENLKIKDERREQYIRAITRGIQNIIPDDRFSVVVEVTMNFDQENSVTNKILPVVLKEDDPATPYDDGERRYSIPISKKSTSEEFVGPSWIPEGPPGFDENVPPAYKGALEQITKYIKNEDIVNETFGEEKSEKVKDPWEITRVSASVLVDGTYEFVFNDRGDYERGLDRNSRERKYNPVTDEDLRKIKGFVEQAIGYSVARGDKVQVYEMQKDRSSQFLSEDAEWIREQQIFWILISVLCGIILIVIIIIVYRLVSKEMERRKRLREEELARQHQLAREMALKSAEEEGVEVEMSIEDKARLEMQENAVNLAREHPEDVAQLIRTWLTEE